MIKFFDTFGYLSDRPNPLWNFHDGITVYYIVFVNEHYVLKLTFSELTEIYQKFSKVNIASKKFKITRKKLWKKKSS